MLLHHENNCNGVVNVSRNLGVHIFLFKHDKMVDCDVDNQSDSLQGQGNSFWFAFMFRLLTWQCVTGLKFECDCPSPSPCMSLTRVDLIHSSFSSLT